jgi:3'-5' exoribonuclease
MAKTMSQQTMFIVPLCEMVNGQEADTFALLTAKEQLTTRDGRPYFRVAFRDARREVSFPVWHDSPLAADCREQWEPGRFYKLRCVYRETDFGPQLEIAKIRDVRPEDAADGFTELLCQPASRYDAAAMFDDLMALAQTHIAAAPLRQLVAGILNDHRDVLLALPAATHNHHACVAGWLEHVRSVTQTAVFLAEKYQRYYDDMQPPLSKDLVVAGAILHDIGKVRELRLEPQGAEYTASGALIGHVLQGRDIVREYVAKTSLSIDADTLLRLEHIIVSHQRLPEWGAPKPPMTPEALLVHYADDVDAKFNNYFTILRDSPGPGPLTSGKNVLRLKLYRGQPGESQ